MSRVALPAAALVILATMLAGAYAMEAYAPAGAPRIVAAWGIGRDGRPADGVEVIGLQRSALRRLRERRPTDPGWSSAIRVVVEDATPGYATPGVIGRYSALGDRIRFEPAFPFTPGVEYRVEVETHALDTLAGLASAEGTGRRLTHRFSLPAVEIDRTTKVVAVHPAVDRVPSNMLRWYVEFSAPMDPGTVDEHVQLLDEVGRPVRDAFLRVDEGLWDVERRRLTLLFDPGRVKRGVRANVEMGAPLIEGRRYRLSIDRAWRDARGARLASGFDKSFDVAPPDRESPDPSRWALNVPGANTREGLRVSFGESLDHALVTRMLRVELGGRPIQGTVAVAVGDSAWTFIPASPWQVGMYNLRVDARLEDVAGNSVGRVFDADRAKGAPPAEEVDRAGAWRTIEFRVR